MFPPTNFNTANPTTAPGKMTASTSVKTMSLAVEIFHPRQVPRNATTATPIRSNVLSGGEDFMRPNSKTAARFKKTIRRSESLILEFRQIGLE
jgi:hypothetical protein